MMRDAAMQLAKAGWPIFPCHSMTDTGCSCGRDDCGSQGKHPRTKDGVKAATADPGQVSLWWKDHPQANIGLATGKPSGTYVIDLDGDTGYGTWEALSAHNGDAPTLMAQTGGGGLHVFYSLPGALDLGNTAKRLGPGIDTRGTGGYVLLAPSNHRSGNRYHWLNGLPVAPVPQWIVDVVQGKGARQQPSVVAQSYRAKDDDALAMRILDEERRNVASTGEGGRNHQLFRSAASMFELVAGGELTAGTVYDVLRDAGLACGLPLWEVERTLKSAAVTGMQSPRIIRTRKQVGL